MDESIILGVAAILLAICFGGMVFFGIKRQNEEKIWERDVDKIIERRK